MKRVKYFVPLERGCVVLDQPQRLHVVGRVEGIEHRSKFGCAAAGRCDTAALHEKGTILCP